MKKILKKLVDDGLCILDKSTLMVYEVSLLDKGVRLQTHDDYIKLIVPLEKPKKLHPIHRGEWELVVTIKQDGSYVVYHSNDPAFKGVIAYTETEIKECFNKAKLNLIETIARRHW